jgi:DNA-binding NarL/FixJ family response regulator
VKRPRILIADDHRIVAEALTKLVELEYEVVGIAGDGRRLVLAVKEFWPEVVIMDIAMPLLNGLDAADQLKLISPKTRVVILTMNQDLEIAGGALRRGAAGFLLKTSAGTELISALREVLRGNIYVTPRIAKGMQEQWAQNPNTEYKKKLTPRQREVLQLLAEGQTMKEAAFNLNIATRTVAFHKYKIMDDFRLRSNAELVQLAIKERILPVPAQ